MGSIFAIQNREKFARFIIRSSSDWRYIQLWMAQPPHWSNMRMLYKHITYNLFNWNFPPLKVVSRWRDSQLQVSGKLFCIDRSFKKLRSMILKSWTALYRFDQEFLALMIGCECPFTPPPPPTDHSRPTGMREFVWQGPYSRTSYDTS